MIVLPSLTKEHPMGAVKQGSYETPVNQRCHCYGTLMTLLWQLYGRLLPPKTLKLLGILALGAFLPGSGVAGSYGAGISNSQWYLAESVFECSLVHEVPGYGRAVFSHRAGEKLSFS